MHEEKEFELFEGENQTTEGKKYANHRNKAVETLPCDKVEAQILARLGP